MTRFERTPADAVAEDKFDTSWWPPERAAAYRRSRGLGMAIVLAILIALVLGAIFAPRAFATGGGDGGSEPQEVTEWHTWLVGPADGTTSVTWPQSYLGAGQVPPECEQKVQQDQYTGTREEIDAILADGVLTDGEDHHVVVAWFVLNGEECFEPDTETREQTNGPLEATCEHPEVTWDTWTETRTEVSEGEWGSWSEVPGSRQSHTDTLTTDEVAQCAGPQPEPLVEVVVTGAPSCDEPTVVPVETTTTTGHVLVDGQWVPGEPVVTTRDLDPVSLTEEQRAECRGPQPSEPSASPEPTKPPAAPQAPAEPSQPVQTLAATGPGDTEALGVVAALLALLGVVGVVAARRIRAGA